ncbi:pentapeptide repeat-containing protein [Ralstonia flaminis]|jgi:hypothetical protein|uniref:Pentapeptide repeat-containing protein n=1 Tax=Ralstonia flaminis TaxID=3058597 RepID=A0ABN9JR01_9RALS|nr:pentapeptide repeat-containing protein [Ralstonia sp. LMG 18101]CAJ0821577.1 hypothetical protein LMG18101_04673 [Ralstonia sp. LMG 18101]
MKNKFKNWAYDHKRAKRRDRVTKSDLYQLFVAVAMLAVVITQTTLLHLQNKRIDEQIYISQAAPAWQALPQIEGLAVQLRKDAKNSCIDREMLVKDARTLGEILMLTCWSELAKIHATTKERYQWLEVWSRQHGRMAEANLNRDGVLVSRYEDSPNASFNVQNFEFIRNAYLEPSVEAAATAEVITEAMLPYRSLDVKIGGKSADTPELSPRPISRERALVLKQFINNGYGPVGNFDSALLDNFEFVNVQLGGIRLKGASLKCASFNGSDLRFATFDDADLRKAKFSRSDLRGSRWNHAILDGASFDRVLMPSAAAFRPASLRNVNLEGAIVDAPDWLTELGATGPVIAGFDASEWVATPDNGHHGYAIARRVPVSSAQPNLGCDPRD